MNNNTITIETNFTALGGEVLVRASKIRKSDSRTAEQAAAIRELARKEAQRRKDNSEAKGKHVSRFVLEVLGEEPKAKEKVTTKTKKPAFILTPEQEGLRTIILSTVGRGEAYHASMQEAGLPTTKNEVGKTWPTTDTVLAVVNAD